MRPPYLIICILFLTKANKALAVTQGLRPLFLLRLPLAPKQASTSRSRRRNSPRSSGLHHSKKNLENRLTQKEKSEEKLRVKSFHSARLFFRFSFVPAPRTDEEGSAICGVGAGRGEPLTSPHPLGYRTEQDAQKDELKLAQRTGHPIRKVS